MKIKLSTLGSISVTRTVLDHFIRMRDLPNNNDNVYLDDGDVEAIMDNYNPEEREPIQHILNELECLIESGQALTFHLWH